MEKRYEWSLLILRVVLGITFLIHGLAKFQGGIENTAGWFESMGLPGFLAYAVALLEVAGGVALAAGLGTKVVSGLLVLLMLGAIAKVKASVGFLGNGQMAGSELDLAFLAIALALFISGSKLYALDQLLFKGKEPQSNASKVV